MVCGTSQPAPLQPPPPALQGEDRATFLAFVKHLGNVPAIVAERNIDAMEYFIWVAKPSVQSWLDTVYSYYKRTSYMQSSQALIEAIDKQRELMRTHPHPEGQRKSAHSLIRLHIAQTPGARSRTPGASNGENNPSQTNAQPKPPGRVLVLPDPMDKFRNAAAHSASNNPLSPPRHPASDPRSPAPLTATPSPNTPSDSSPTDSACSAANVASPACDLPPGPSFHPHDHFGPYVAYIDDIDRRCSTHPESITKDEWNRFLDYRYGPADNPYHKRKPPPPPANTS